MKKTKKLQNNESSENPDEFFNEYEFIEMPDAMYVPKNSKLIGESADRIKKEFCIDNMLYYNPLKVKKDGNVISHKNSVELAQGMKLTSGHLFVIGQWGGIKRFEETYNLDGELRENTKSDIK